MKKGDRVRMTEAYKMALKLNGCNDHVGEFGNCIGIVEDPIDFGSQKGPEWNVRWQPSNLRGGYHPDNLVIVK